MKKLTKRILITMLAFFGLSNIVNSQALLKELEAGTISSGPTNFIEVNGSMYFVTTSSATFNRRIWKSDGTAAGTVILKDSVIASNNGNVVIPIAMNNTLYYVINPNKDAFSTNRASLWKSDGTTAGTVLIDSLVTESPLASNGTGHAQPRNYTVVGNKLFFQMGKGDGLELWVTDGTEGGLHQVTDLSPGTAAGVMAETMIAFDGRVYFQGSSSGMGGVELYASDGTAAGTVLIKKIDLSSGMYPGGSKPGSFIVHNNKLYFYTTHGTSIGIWETDGTEANTKYITDGPFNNPVIFKNAIYFGKGADLWKTDGTAAGTVFVTDSATTINGANDDYLIASYVTSIPVAPYIEFHYKRIDGNTGTPVSTNVGYGASFNVVNNIMYGNGGADYGLWNSDGTEAGSGQLSNNISSTFFAFNGSIYYNAWGTGMGYELWSLNIAPTSGIKTTNNNQVLSVYPNPSSGIFTYNSSTPIFEIKIYTILGEMIYSEKFNTNQAEINLSKHQKGIYFYQLTDINQQLKTGKIIIE